MKSTKKILMCCTAVLAMIMLFGPMQVLAAEDFSYSLADDGTTAILSKMNHLCTRIGLLIVVSHSNRVELTR